jgi:hypothetical protein
VTDADQISQLDQETGYFEMSNDRSGQLSETWFRKTECVNLEPLLGFNPDSEMTSQRGNKTKGRVTSILG